MSRARCLAYGEPGYPADMAHSFAEGARRGGASAEVRSSFLSGAPERCDAVWMYGMHASEWLFLAYSGLAVRIVGDLGYWREDIAGLPMRKRPVRVSVEAQQPDKHLRLRAHPSDRFEALGLHVEPVKRRGEYILVAAHDPIQAKRNGYEYGEWEELAVARLRRLTLRPIVLREKPSCAPIALAGVLHSEEPRISSALRGAWAVVCLTGNVGADAILHGVPCFAQEGPGAVYGGLPLEWIDDAKPLEPEQRLAALSDLAYWQWTQEEFSSGALWAHLRAELLH